MFGKEILSGHLAVEAFSIGGWLTFLAFPVQG
jgi:hypothetical protein